MVNMEKTFITPLNSLVSDTKVSGSFLGVGTWKQLVKDYHTIVCPTKSYKFYSLFDATYSFIDRPTSISLNNPSLLACIVISPMSYDKR
jgi:hypothetical protein